MLIREKVIAALEEKREHFAHYQSARRRQLAQVEDRLDLVSGALQCGDPAASRRATGRLARCTAHR